jgi:hypothetical protein
MGAAATIVAPLLERDDALATLDTPTEAGAEAARLGLSVQDR